MKNRILFIFLIIAASATAQGKRDFPPFEELIERKWQEISTKANLTEDEKKAVYPIFIEYENSVFALNKTLWDTFKHVKASKEKSENINFAEINEVYINNEIKLAALLKNYHEKLKKVLSPETLFNYYMAERSFKKGLMQKMPNKSNIK
ncbi:MAG: hypothetical protein FWF72_00940 [Paludibacter sp.]|nr:hypothetical protein [Paludibacter sp.]